MKRKKRIALISSQTLSLINFRGPLIQALVKAGYEVFAYGPEETTEDHSELKKLGATLRSYPLKRVGLNPKDDICAFWSLYRDFQKINPDIVLSYTMKPSVWGSIAAKLAGVEKIFSLQTGLGYAFIGDEIKTKLIGMLLSQMLKIAFLVNDKILVYNQDIIKEFTKRRIFRSSKQIELIAGSGVNMKHYSYSPLPDGPLRFILVARLLIDKGIREYVAAARIVKEKYPDIIFDLVGPFDPNPKGLTQKEVDGWINKGIIAYHGFIKDVRPYLRQASVFVLPSYAEGISRSILEAMAMGRTIITTDAPGCRETIEHEKSGLIVPPRDVEALVEAMLFLIKHPKIMKTFSYAAYKRVQRRYDVNIINSKILKTIHQ